MTPVKVIIEADGGSRGNPGPAGYGAVVYASDHRTVLAERAESIGIATNNVAEYRGLIAGLAAAQELGATEVAIRMDSKLVVEQMTGRWQIKHPAMVPLAEQARQLDQGFNAVSYQWIPRAQNSYADRLANEAMDAAAGIAPKAAAPVETTPVAAPGWTGASGAPLRLLLLRHGQTEASVRRAYSGRDNPALTATGHWQAQQAAARLARHPDVAAVVSSPLLRAQQTAAAVGAALRLPVTEAMGLIETDFGAWEGLTFSEAAQRDPQLHARWLGDTSVHPPQGESLDETHVRVQAQLAELISDYAGQTIVVVTHVTPVKTFIRLALDTGPSLLFRLHLDIASLSIAEFYPDANASVRLVNDTTHLDQAGQPVED